MNLVLEFPAADAANFSAGQTAQVTLDGTFEVLPGTITAVTGTDALSTGNLLTRTVTLSVSNAGGLTTAQAATATINGVSSIAAANFQYQAERTLTALASGTVTAINVREGGSVNKDDIILTLSGEELRIGGFEPRKEIDAQHLLKTDTAVRVIHYRKLTALGLHKNQNEPAAHRR